MATKHKSSEASEVKEVEHAHAPAHAETASHSKHESVLEQVARILGQPEGQSTKELPAHAQTVMDELVKLRGVPVTGFYGTPAMSSGVLPKAPVKEGKEPKK